MLKNINELKDLILFCKQEKISTLQVGDVQVQFSELALVDNIQSVAEMEKELNNLSSKTLADDPDSITKEQLEKEYEEALFWSSQS